VTETLQGQPSHFDSGFTIATSIEQGKNQPCLARGAFIVFFAGTKTERAWTSPGAAELPPSQQEATPAFVQKRFVSIRIFRCSG